jgi:hypothetical protein
MRANHPLIFSFRQLLLLLTLLVTSLAAKAQFDSASVLGTVRDSSGASMANVTVALTSIANGTQQTLTTNGKGEYEFASVKPGEYRLTGEATGFKMARVERFAVAVAARQRIDLQMEVGGTSETFSVTAGDSMVETDTSDRGQVIGRREIVELPLNGRSYADLALLVPGVRKSVLENQTLSSRDPPLM